MSTTTISADTTTWLITLLGAEAVVDMTRPLTDQEQADIEHALTRYDGNVAAAAGVCVDADTAAYLQSLPVGGPR